MESRVKFLGHALHQQLIPFPLGLLVTAVLFDVLYLLTDSRELATAAYWMIAAGVVAGVAAVIPGTLDWLAIPPDTRAKFVGLVHGWGNILVLVLFAISWMIRRGDETSPEGLAIALAVAGATVSGLTAWLGGELIDRLGVGIDNGAHLDSPNSLSGRPAAEGASHSRTT